MFKIILFVIFIFGCAKPLVLEKPALPPEPSYSQIKKTKNEPWAYDCDRKISKCVNNDDAKIIEQNFWIVNRNFEQCEFHREMLKTIIRPEIKNIDH